MRKIARKSIVARSKIEKGKIITRSMIAVKRPGTGIELRHFNKVIGKTALKTIKEDEVIKWQWLS